MIDSQYVIPYRDATTHSSATRQSGTVMKHVDHAAFIVFRNADNITLHQEFNPAIPLPDSLIELMVGGPV